MKKKTLYLSILAVIGLIVITISATVAFFNYAKSGSTENTITSSSLTFIYEEVNRIGNGISITDALPISDTEGKAQTNYFDFKVTSTSAPTIAIPYEITARVVDGSDDISDYVKVYLTKVNGNSEEQKVLSIFSDLDDSTNILASQFNDKTLYEDEIPAGSSNFVENYRLRMWLDSSVDFSDGILNDKEFSIKINVYANGEQATQQKIESASATDINGLKINNVSAILNTDSTLNYDYYVETTLGDTNDFELIPLNNGETYTVENITEQEANTIKGVSAKQNLNLSLGYNYLKLTVTSANRQNTEVYVIKVLVEAPTEKLVDAIFEKYPLSGVRNDPTLGSTSAAADENGLYSMSVTDGFGGQDGTTYYFRGNVDNNYVSFAGKIWRIVRINEDGTIRLIMRDSLGNKKINTAYTTSSRMYYSSGNEAKNTLNSWYTTNITNVANNSSKVATGNYFCEAAKVGYTTYKCSGATNFTYYSSYTPTLQCIMDQQNKQFVSSGIGLITYDEVVLAGGNARTSNTNYYLSSGSNFWTMSPANTDDSCSSYVWYVSSGGLYAYGVDNATALRPVINLVADVEVKGEGTSQIPWTVQ